LNKFDTNINFPEEGLTVSCEVEDLGNSKFKLLEHPIFATQAKYGDVILASFESKEKLKFQKVIEASDYEVLDYVFSKEISESEKFNELLNSLTEKGVFWQQDFGGVFCFFVKPDQAKETKQLVLSTCT
tara:strand:+ start:2056 stop:2442 length:387 start_codon:yes stop_codon:yes gene_type:complete